MQRLTRENLSPSEWIRAGSLTCETSAEPVLSPEEIMAYPTDAPRFRRILFIAPQPHGYDVPPAPTPSFGYLGEMLSQYGFQWRLLDLRLGGTIEDVRAAIRTYKPDVIGYSFQFTVGASGCVQFLHSISKVSDLPIIVGGTHLVFRGFNIMEDVPNVLAAVRREGEFSLLAIMKGVPLENVPNLWLRDGNVVIETPETPYITNLDLLPFPKFCGYISGKYPFNGQIDVLTSRGCPFRCSFCSVWLTQGRSFRSRTPEHVLEELVYWYRRGVRRFNFVDDNLLADQRRFDRLVSLIARAQFRDVEFSCTQGMRADCCNVDLLLKMKEIGFNFLGFGVESASDRVLKIINKGESISVIDEAIATACEIGFDVGLFFIIGLPTETNDDVISSCDFACKYPVKYAKFHTCIPYPGTKIAKWVDQHSKWYVTPDVYLNNLSYLDDVVLFDNKGMSYDDHLRMLKYSSRVDESVRRRYTARKSISKGIPPAAAKFMSYCVYNRLTFSALRRFSKTRLGSKIRNVAANLMRLESSPSTDSKSFSDLD